MKIKTEIVKSVFGGWWIVYRLDNGFPVPADSKGYRFKWMAQLRRWWVEVVHGNYVEG